MKKLLLVIMSFGLFAFGGLMLVGCSPIITESDFSLYIIVSQEEIQYGDTVSVVGVLQNNSGQNISIRYSGNIATPFVGDRQYSGLGSADVIVNSVFRSEGKKDISFDLRMLEMGSNVISVNANFSTRGISINIKSNEIVVNVLSQNILIMQENLDLGKSVKCDSQYEQKNFDTSETVYSENQIVVVLNQVATQGLVNLSRRDFRRLRLESIEEITPGRELAEAQLRANRSRRERSNYYDASWSVNLNEFRQIFLLTLRNPGHENVLNAIEQLNRMSKIYSAEPNYFLESEELEQFPYSYSYKKTFENFSSNLWSQNSINASQAWRISRGEGIKIGLLSSGVRISHNELQGRIY